MQDQSDKSSKDSPLEPDAKNGEHGAKYRVRLRRRAAHIRNSAPESADCASLGTSASKPDKDLSPAARGYDPELLYVECGRCGSPVLWEEGRAGRLLFEAGIDPLELDSSCILLTDGCPACGSAREYSVRIFRLSEQGAANIMPLHGHA